MQLPLSVSHWLRLATGSQGPNLFGVTIQPLLAATQEAGPVFCSVAFHPRPNVEGDLAFDRAQPVGPKGHAGPGLHLRTPACFESSVRGLPRQQSGARKERVKRSQQGRESHEMLEVCVSKKNKSLFDCFIYF